MYLEPINQSNSMLHYVQSLICLMTLSVLRYMMIRYAYIVSQQTFP